MRIKRKAQQSGVGTIGAIILVLIVVVVVGSIFRGTAENAAVSFSSLDLNNRRDICKIKGENILGEDQQPKEEIEGEKKDNYPDDCDLCLGGDDRIMTNSYGIPDACYSDPKKNDKIKSYKDMCKARGGCYISDTDQCCLTSVVGADKCGTKCK
jgi:hypothetical protein